MTPRPARAAVLLLLGALALAACGSAASEDADGAGGPGADGGLSGDLTVFAAASLHAVFEELAELFEAAHPDTSVTFSFGGSSDLVAQLYAGAPVDVLATADEATMARTHATGTIAHEPVIFAENSLTLVVPPGNPGGVTGLDASLDGADLVLCAPQVPCGAATLALTELLDVSLTPVSEEGSVTDVLGKITSDQADAGLVYTTDAAAAGDAVETIAVERAEEVVNRYPIAVTVDAAEPELAAAWVELVLGPEAQQVLDRAGFGTP